MKDVQLKKLDSELKSVRSLEEMFDDGEYITDEEFLESYEYIETNSEGHEIWQLKPHIRELIKEEYNLDVEF